MKTIFLNLEYTGDSLSGYQGVEVWTGENRDKRLFATGDVVQDLRDAFTFAFDRAARTGERVASSSSLGDFVMDVPGFHWTSDTEIAPDDPVWYAAQVSKKGKQCPSQFVS